MCGIAGLYRYRSAYPDTQAARQIVSRMTDSMAHRGPDSDGVWSDELGRCVLGHRRLSIIDTSDAGLQPMHSTASPWCITFNGELYNFLELRPQLESAGVRFHGRTDTEVLLEALALWGTAALKRFDGMFAFAAFNERTGELVAARDPFGEKPFYYMELPGGGLAFASELQALELLPGFDGEVSVDAMAEVLMFQYVGAPRSIYKHVKKLPPGHVLRVSAEGEVLIERYFEFAPGSTGFDGRRMPDLVDELEDLLVRSLRRRLIADVPLGAFLSGGVDSSTVCALAAKRLGVPLKTFSIGFNGAAESEHDAARKFARHLGTQHYDEILTPDTNAFLANIGRILDEPNADSSCMPTYLLAAFARKHVTVALSGDGGDELFAGYGRYFATLDEEAAAGASGWRAGDAYYADRILVSTDPYIEELFGAVPSGLAKHVQRLRDEVSDGDVPLHCRLRRTDAANYMPGAVLPKVDRMSMQHSLEVRTPFLNPELARFAERLQLSALYQGKGGKLLLRELAYRYLPKALIDAPKQGFGIPMSRWGREALLGVAGQLLEGDDSILRRSLGAGRVDTFLARQRGSGYSTYQVWGLAMLESWARHHPLARFPDLSAVVPPKPTAPRHAESRLVPVANQVYAAIPDATSGRMSATLSNKITKLAVYEHVKRAAAACGRSTTPKAAESARTEPDVGGASVLFPLENAATYLSWQTLESWRARGAHALLFFHPHSPQQDIIRFELRHFSLKQRIANAVRLAWHRAGHFGTSRKIAKLTGGAYYRGQRGQLYCSTVNPRVEAAQDQELSGVYALFEGMRQLPPVPVSHDEIAELGGGRYSVWNRQCHFAASEPQRLGKRPYWLVPNNATTQGLLPIAFSTTHRAAGGDRDFLAQVHAYFTRSGETPAPKLDLAPGARIVVLTHGLPAGGAERQWCYLAQSLKKLGFSVSFVVTEELSPQNSHYLPLLRDAGIEVVEIAAQSLSQVLERMPTGAQAEALLDSHGNPFSIEIYLLSALLRDLSPQVVFAQLDATNILAAIAAHLADVPRVVLSFRNYNPSNFSYLVNDWFLPCYQAACLSPRTVLVGNSNDANRDYTRWIGVPDERVQWVPNAIDDKDFAAGEPLALAQLRAELGVGDAAQVLLGVFRLSEEKQPDVFLDVAARVLAQLPDLKVLVAGEGRLHQALERRIDELGIGHAVTLLGRRNDVPALMRIADVMLLTSSHEGMPNAVMEAQLLGLPVVATRTGGTPDCVVHEQTGLLADVGDVEALYRSTLRLLHDPSLAKAMGDAGAARMRQYFSKEAMAVRYVKLLGGQTSIKPDRALETAA